jgi:hypothetical protein
MNTEDHLLGLAIHCIDQAKSILDKKSLNKSLNIYAICLYGGGALYQYRKKSNYKDYDVQIFLEKTSNYKTYDSSKLNRHGGIWKAGVYNDKPVELFFGVISHTGNDISENIRNHIRDHFSDRWKRIKKNPVLILWPERHDFEFIEQ